MFSTQITLSEYKSQPGHLAVIAPIGRPSCVISVPLHPVYDLSSGSHCIQSWSLQGHLTHIAPWEPMTNLVALEAI